MLALSNTENFTGIRISGDYWDFEELSRAIEKLLHTIVASNEYLIDSYSKLQNLCNNLKMTKHGESNIETTFNGISTKIRSSFAVDFPLQNIYFSTEETWPEIFFTVICLNNFLYEAYGHKEKLLLEPHVLVIRKFQAAIFQCLSSATNIANRQYFENLFYKRKDNLQNYVVQYIDFLSMQYVAASRNTHLERLPYLLAKIHAEDNEYLSFKHRILDFAKKSNLPVHMVTLEKPSSISIIW